MPILVRHGIRIAGFLLFLGVIVLYSVPQLNYQHTTLSTGSRESGPSSNVADNISEHSLCEFYPDEGDIAISVKTGATEAFEKLPPILRTSLKCIQDVMVFSDLEQDLGNLHIHDVLSRFSPEAMEFNEDFEIYRMQKDLLAQHRESEIQSLAALPAHPHPGQEAGKSASWALDRYKFLHMLERAYELQPARDWYVFLEADTYLSWANLKRWLASQDPDEKLYLGYSQRKADSRPPLNFAHGGSGIVLSGAAMKKLVLDHYDVASRTDQHAHQWWAGDIMLADILYKEVGLEVTDMAPMFNGLDPSSIPFSDISWCEPAITLHHMGEKDFKEIFRKEKELEFSRLLLRDVYAAYYPSALPARRDDWDNMSDDMRYILDPKLLTALATDPNTSFEACQEVCQAIGRCLQFEFRNITVLKSGTPGFQYFHQCHLSSAFRLGYAKPSQPIENPVEYRTARSWTGGWQSDRIKKWVDEHWKCT